MSGPGEEEQRMDGLQLAPAPAARQHHPPSQQQLSSSPSTSRRHPSHQRDGHEPHLVFDIRQHPAAIAYAAAHPNRTIPKFGPYILLQTLGEGEFGKVKLGLHSHWAEEVAVKLIRRGSVENDVRMQKIRREIAVLEVRLSLPSPAARSRSFFLGDMFSTLSFRFLTDPF